jgi:hypothetical protein
MAEDNKGTVAIDPESQQPIRATDVRLAEPAVPPRVVYVAIQEGPYPGMYNQNDGVQPDPGVFCAAMGLAFSWIPIVGCLTFAVNANAPRNSARFSLASAACAVSSLVVIFNIIFWSLYTPTMHHDHSDDMHNN